MKTHTTIEFRLHAEVNDEVFDMNGEGVGNSDEGTCVLHLEASPKFPKGFDPISCPNICSHPTSSFFSRCIVEGTDLRTVSGNAYVVAPARHGCIYNAIGEKVLDLHVDGNIRMEGGRLISEHKMRGFSNLPALKQNLTPFDDYLIPSGEGEATALVRFKLLAVDGEELDGVTVVPYRWDSGRELRSPMVRRVEDIQVEWDGARRVTTYYRTAVRPLSVQKETEFQLTLPVGMGDPAVLLQMAGLSKW